MPHAPLWNYADLFAHPQAQARGLRVTVGTIVGLIAAGSTNEEILREYPYLEAPDIAEALSYAAWRAEEVEVPLGHQ